MLSISIRLNSIGNCDTFGKMEFRTRLAAITTQYTFYLFHEHYRHYIVMLRVCAIVPPIPIQFSCYRSICHFVCVWVCYLRNSNDTPDYKHLFTKLYLQ